MDYAFVPHVSEWELAYRKAMDVRPSTVRYPKDSAAPGSMIKLTEFLAEMRSVALASSAADSLILCAHADDNAQLFTLLSDAHELQLKTEGRKVHVVLYEHLEQAVASGDINIPGPVVMPRPLDANGQPKQAFFHIKGCRIGHATPFLQKLKDALGGQVKITAPKYFHMLMSSDAKDDGAYEYMGHSFVVFSRTKVTDRKALIATFKGKNFKLIDGTTVPPGLWAIWVDKKFTKLRKRTITIDVTISPKVGKFALYGSSWGEFRHSLEKFTYRIPNGASRPTKRADRIALLRTQLGADPTFATTHAYPIYARYEHADLDEFMAARYWAFDIDKKNDELICVGTRHEYTCVMPSVIKQGKKLVLEKFNYYAYAGAGSVTDRLVESNTEFFAEV